MTLGTIVPFIPRAILDDLLIIERSEDEDEVVVRALAVQVADNLSILLAENRINLDAAVEVIERITTRFAEETWAPEMMRRVAEVSRR